MYFPAKLEELSPAIIEAILEQDAPGTKVSHLELVSHSQCGDGLASTADRLKLKLTYSANPKALPEVLLCKTILLHRFLRFGLPVIIGLSQGLNTLDKVPFIGKIARPLTFTLINIYQRFFPHAPEAMYANEVHFYQHIRPSIDCEMPKAFGTAFDQKTGQFAVLMEDLSPKQAHFPNATEERSLEEVKSLLDGLATLHAKYWQSSELEKLSWLPKTFEGGMFPVFDAIGLDVIKDQVKKNLFKQDLLKPLNRNLDEQWAALWKSQQFIYENEALTLLHGDTHVGNSYTLPEGRAGWLDFQLMVKGPWVHDVTYILMTALSTEQRRKHEVDLIQYYLDQVSHKGVDHGIDIERALHRYHITAVWGLVIGWLITPPQNYGEAITFANIQRLAQACQDFDTFNKIDQL